MALYIPHSNFNLARFFYVRPETFWTLLLNIRDTSRLLINNAYLRVSKIKFNVCNVAATAFTVLREKGKILLNWIIKKQDKKSWTEIINSGQEKVVGCFEHDNVSSGSTNTGTSLTKLEHTSFSL